MPNIVLCTLNARYVHAGLAVRYLRANMGDLREHTRIVEFVIGQRPADIVEQVLALGPRVVGLSVYIWNVEETTRIAAMLKQVAPEVIIILGGPEVSHETADQRICALADYVITGWGEIALPRLATALLRGERPSVKVIAGAQPPLAQIALPYAEYSEEDVAKRFIYVEASRGCPFKCEFCLSALDKTAWPFDLDRLLAALDALHARGARHFRFVDRTFNLKASSSLRLLEFFLERMDKQMFLHFELIPDHLPEVLKQAIVRFPPGSLHFEVGIQTWNTEVQALISRRQDNACAEANLRWLRDCSPALVHVDLIAGLPGEDIASFGHGFDRLLALRPHEIQVGILKRLRGAPIARHTDAFAMRYNTDPPYNVLSTDRISFAEMQRLVRFARYWDMVGNSGRFARTLTLLLGTAPQESAFERFLHFTDWLYRSSGKTHEIGLERLCDAVYAYLTAERGVDAADAAQVLTHDYEASGAKGRLGFMQAGVRPSAGRTSTERARLRQVRHLQTGSGVN
jgi:B12 binding protein/uncharacterized protein DUF4080/radical SAM family protein